MIKSSAERNTHQGSYFDDSKGSSQSRELTLWKVKYVLHTGAEYLGVVVVEKFTAKVPFPEDYLRNFAIESRYS